MDLMLSQFPNRKNIVLKIRRSRGLKKKIRIGANEIESDKLSIILDPMSDIDFYSVRTAKSGGIVLEQSESGEATLKITPDIRLVGQSAEPEGDYLYSETRVLKDHHWEVAGVYIPLLRKEGKL